MRTMIGKQVSREVKFHKGGHGLGLLLAIGTLVGIIIALGQVGR